MVRSSPPEMANSTPLAPWMETSRSGELMAASAAFSARFSPEAVPMRFDGDNAATELLERVN